MVTYGRRERVGLEPIGKVQHLRQGTILSLTASKPVVGQQSSAWKLAAVRELMFLAHYGGGCGGYVAVATTRQRLTPGSRAARG
jgi:hypothetical protein